MVIRDWSPGVCSSDLAVTARAGWIVPGASSIPVSAVKTTSDITRGLRSATSAATGGPSDRTACCSVGISMLALDQRVHRRPDGRRLGKECVITCRARRLRHTNDKNTHVIQEYT